MNKTLIRLNPLRSAAHMFAVAVLAAGSLAAADVTFAQFFQLNGSQQQWSITDNGSTTTITASGSVSFLFSTIPGLPFAGAQTANFTLSATSTQVGNCAVSCGPNDGFTQQGYSGSFSFIDTQSAPGANLLSGTFAVTAVPASTGALFGSNVGSSAASFRASSDVANPSQLILTSDYVNFTSQTQQTASFSLSSVNPDFSVAQLIATQARPGPSFAAAGTGTFSSSPGVVGTPEPGSVFLIGGGLLGLGMIRRRKLSRQ